MINKLLYRFKNPTSKFLMRFALVSLVFPFTQFISLFIWGNLTWFEVALLIPNLGACYYIYYSTNKIKKIL